MEKILVLGGSYFVGRKIVEYLASNGFDVTVLNRGTKMLSGMFGQMNVVHQLTCDRNNEEDMAEGLKGKSFDYIIDVSWQDLVWVQNACQAIDFTNVKKMIFISSSAVYDVEHLSIPFKENDTLHENKYWTFYGKGKIDAEAYYTQFLKGKRTKLVILRPPYIYGEYNYAQRESLIFRQLVDNQPIAIPSSDPKLQFIYTEDLADYILTLLHVSLPDVYIANVGNEAAVTGREWIEACGDVARIKPRIIEVNYKEMSKNVRDFYPFFDYDNVLDISKMRKQWNRETDFLVGLERSYKWFVENRKSIVFKERVDQTLYEIIAATSV